MFEPADQVGGVHSLRSLDRGGQRKARVVEICVVESEINVFFTTLPFCTLINCQFLSSGS